MLKHPDYLHISDIITTFALSKQLNNKQLKDYGKTTKSIIKARN